jgi:hypothetical protein
MIKKYIFIYIKKYRMEKTKINKAPKKNMNILNSKKI